MRAGRRRWRPGILLETMYRHFDYLGWQDVHVQHSEDVTRGREFPYNEQTLTS